MVEWLKNFFVPLIEIIFIGGIAGFVGIFIGKAVWNAWSKSFKFIIKYSIRRKPLPEDTVKWCIECLDNGIGYYDAKKMLLIKGTEQSEINEIMWVFDKIIIELNNKSMFLYKCSR